MKQYVVDAFTEHVFSGNPAAVCIMDKWLDQETMMNITRENNLSETAFAVLEGDKYHLRWFTPGGEIDLCGHATLGTAYVIMEFVSPELNEVHFNTMSGELVVTKKKDLYEMDFPAYELKPVEITDEIVAAIGKRPLEAYMGRDLLCVFENENDIRELTPDMDALLNIDGLLLQVTAKGEKYDCVSRSFAPKLNVIEDPVCGSGHCHIIPYWAEKLGKNQLVAYQASRRGGELYCTLKGDHILMAGKAALYSEAEIHID